MKTAVEWFAKELYEKFEMKGDGKVFDDLLEQANNMEWQNIYKAHRIGLFGNRNINKELNKRGNMGILKDLTNEMKNDPWHVKLKRWLRFKKWLWKCHTRLIWDLSYERNIFKTFKSE
jgi:hypothetical protein